MRSPLPRCLVVAALLVACADETTAPAPAVPQPIPATLPAVVTMDAYLMYAAQVECAALFRCPAAGDGAGLRLLFGSYERCVANADELAGEVDRARWRQLVGGGSSRYDAAAARRCLEALRDGPCSERPPEACFGVFEGTVATGGACRRHDDCADDGWCRFEDARGGAPCPGVCTPRAPVGASCRSGTEECSQRNARAVVSCGYFPALEGTANPFRCTDTGTAPAGSALADAGQSCDEFRGGGRTIATCAPGLDCITRDHDGLFVGRCEAPQPLGATCGRYCQGNAVCTFDGSLIRRCQAIVVRNREGERCVQGNAGAEVCNAVLGLDCVAGTCQRVGTGEEGSPCFTARFGVDNCRAGLVCHTATQTCRPRAAVGAPCSAPDECESRLCTTDGTGPARCVSDTGCGV
jgi:hypothetical protein